MALATFGAGCFWGVEENFRQVPGVKATAVGYMGGIPTYEDACANPHGACRGAKATRYCAYQRTCAEVVQIEYDPAEVGYKKLLEIFWANHNPTTPNRQGPDVGAQYRSVIFFHTSSQEKLAQASKEALEKSGKWKNPIVTQIVPATAFYIAEDYHQQYLAKRGLGSCHV